MKTRLIVIAILLLMLTVLLSRSDEHISDTLLGIINPIKQGYKNFTQGVEDKGHSYIFQKEYIEKISVENKYLRKRLLQNIHYIEEVKNIYDILPDLSRLPIHNISITETISYVKLNSFSQIVLTKPKGLEENKLYGLIQNRVVGGVARVKKNQLYGYLTSDEKCRFSVFIGKDKAPGIALGVEKNIMIVKFIPKWHKIEVGDSVVTSGLDAIFFSDIPVGLVTKVEIKSSYSVAHIKTYSDIFHPKTFFLINNARATLTEGFDSNNTQRVQHVQRYIVPHVNDEQNSSIVAAQDENGSAPSILSIPSRIDQTQDDVVEPEEKNETVIMHKTIKKIKNSRKHRKVQKTKKVKKRKAKRSTLDLF